jgi:predicted DNA-binding transcriptional regulator YafY
MRRADRLFQIVQLLRARGTVTAAELAGELAVSERTIYRDVRDLMLAGVPIQGEAGVGYALPRGFDLPPLMFSEGELSALVLGASMVQAFADEALAQEARNLLAKVQAVLPERLRPTMQRSELLAPPFHREDLAAHLEPLRHAIKERRILSLEYVAAGGEASVRRVHPLGLYFWGSAWTLTAWCELREDFRTFRPDRIRKLEDTGDRFEPDPERDLDAFLARMSELRANREP